MTTPILSPEETRLIEGLDTSCLMLITKKIAMPGVPFNKLAVDIWPDVAIERINQIIGEKYIVKAYDLITSNPTIAANLMLTSLYPYAVGVLLLMSADIDERSNVRVTAAKELTRLGGYAQEKINKMNERITNPSDNVSKLLDSNPNP